MDKTEQNIKMCKKAKEIQEGWKPSIGDWFYKEDGIGYGFWLVCKVLEDSAGPQLLCSGERDSKLPFSGFPITFLNPENYIWLPNQNQLQKMSGLDWRSFDKKCLVYENLVLVPTKEHASIRVVMKEKHNKIWDGEDWVKK